MTYHTRSVVEFGRLLSEMTRTLVEGGSLSRIAEMIRIHLSADAVALRAQDISPGSEATIALAKGGAEPQTDGDLARCMAALLETHRQVLAQATNDLTGMRCSLHVFMAVGEGERDLPDQGMCEVMVTQLRNGIELAARMGSTEIERTLYSDIIDRLSVGVVIVDLSGRVVNRSASANETLAASDGLLVQGDRLRASVSADDRKLQMAIRALSKTIAEGQMPAARAISLGRPSGKRNLGVLIRPVEGVCDAGYGAGVCLALCIRDPSAVAPMEGNLMRDLFDLTPAEAAVAGRLTAGLSLEDAASSLDISRNTARAHLRSIFSKSGISRQTELVRLMLNSAVVLGQGPRQPA